jgi:hypothetical protein
VDAWHAPVKGEVDGPARAAAVEADMILGHGGGGRRDGDGSGEAGAPGAGGYTDYETDTATEREDDVVTVEVGEARDEPLDVRM